MGEDAQIDDELYDRIYERMLQRLRDLFPIVRIQAVFALARLQDPTDEDCPIINGQFDTIYDRISGLIDRAQASSAESPGCGVKPMTYKIDTCRYLAWHLALIG